MTDSPSAVPLPEDEVVRICRELIQIDSSNYGDGSGPGERAAAEYVMGQLTEVGLEPTYLESEPGRASVVVRVEGADRSRPGLRGPRPPRRRTRRTRPTGRWTRSAPRSATAASGAAAPWT